MQRRWAFFFMYDGVLTGGPKRTLDTAIAVRKHGIEPLVVSNTKSPIIEKAQDKGIECKLLEIPASLRERQGKALSLNPKNLLELRSDIRGVDRQIFQLIVEQKLDGWWSRGIKAVLMARKAVRRTKVPLVWDMGTEYKSRGLAALVHCLGFQACTRAVAQGEHVLSQTFPSWMRAWFGHKFTVLIPGLATERVEKLEAIASRYKVTDPITVVGTINSRKNQLMLIEACNSLFEEGREFKVRFVGAPTDEDYFQECQRASKLFEQNYDWYGWSDDVPEILSKSSAVVISSKQEGLPQTVLEAMHAARPVISVPVGGVPDLIVDGSNGFLADKQHPVDLRDALGRFLDCSPKDLDSIRMRGVDTVNTRANHSAWEQGYAQLLLSLSAA